MMACYFPQKFQMLGPCPEVWEVRLSSGQFWFVGSVHRGKFCIYHSCWGWLSLYGPRSWLVSWSWSRPCMVVFTSSCDVVYGVERTCKVCWSCVFESWSCSSLYIECPRVSRKISTLRWSFYGAFMCQTIMAQDNEYICYIEGTVRLSKALLHLLALPLNVQ